jgi:hypothetical protein
MNEIHDTSRLDAYMRSRQRVALLHAVWRPMLAGAAGAALVIAAVWVTLPKLSYREIEVPRVSYKDAEVPRIVPHDVTVDHVIPHDVPIDIPIPRIVPETSAAAPRSKEAFVASPEYRAAELSGRIAGSDGANGFLFEDGRRFTPARLGPDGKIEYDRQGVRRRLGADRRPRVLRASAERPVRLSGLARGVRGRRHPRPPRPSGAEGRQADPRAVDGRRPSGDRGEPTTDKVVVFPPPEVDLVDVYLALLDSGAEFEHPRLAELRALLSEDERARLVAQLRVDSARTTRRADALEKQMRIWRTNR